MAIIEARRPGPAPAGDAGVPVSQRTGRRDTFEAVGLVVGILGVLLVVVTIGAGPPF